MVTLTVSGPDPGLDSRTFSDQDREVWVGLLQSDVVLLHKVSVKTKAVELSTMLTADLHAISSTLLKG